MNKPSKRLPDDYAALLAEVKERVYSAQYEALKAVNKELVALYWDIGKFYLEYCDGEKLQPLVGEIISTSGGRGMNGLRSRLHVHLELECLNSEAVKLAAIIKKNFKELGI